MVVAAGFLTPPLQASVELVPLTNVWRFEQTTNLDSVAWWSPGYDDSNWPTGKALLYVESNLLVSPRNTPLTIGRTTYYFRSHFQTPFALTNAIVSFSSRIDDGAVFYVNGREVLRVRMPAAPTVVTYSTLATSTPAGGDATSTEVFVLPESSLTNFLSGDNVLAVEVHQNITSSDDVVFGTALTWNFTNAAPVVIRQPADAAVPDGWPATLAAVVDGEPSPTLQWFKGNDPVSGATNATLNFAAAYPTNAGTYWLMASNRWGSVRTSNAVLTVLADTNPPTIVAAIAQKNLTNITVTFSEPVRAASATSTNNYIVFQTAIPSNRIEVLGVSMSGNSAVVLRTPPRVAGLNYSLRVNGIQDISSVSNAIAPDSSVALSYLVDLIAVDAATTWRFFQQGSLPATNWMAASYDDSNWPQGAGVFAGGSPAPSTTDPIRTTLALTAGPNAVVTYYFRTFFNLPGSLSAGTLRLRDIADDGAIFYLNGSEVFSIGMPATRPVDFATSASRTVGTAAYEPSLTVPGWSLSESNLLTLRDCFAVELHQRTNSLADTAFAANLEAVITRYHPRLQLSAPAIALEGAGTLTDQASVSILEPLATNLVLQVASARPADVVLPLQVVIPAGTTNASFSLTVNDDLLFNGPRTVTLTATSPGVAMATANLLVLDNETNTIQLVIAPTTTETNGSLPGEIRFGQAAAADLAVSLVSSDLSELIVPASVIVPAGATSAAFQVTVVDDGLLDGAQTVTLSASVAGWPAAATQVVVMDNESTLLGLVTPATILEGSGVLPNAGKVTLGGIAVSNLTVTLSSSDPASLIVPTNVTITAGQSNAFINLVIPDDYVVEPTRVVSVAASAPGLISATNNVTVIDNDPHHIRFGPVVSVTDTNTLVGVMMYAENADGSAQTNFNLGLRMIAEGLEGVLPIEPTNTAGFAGGQRYESFRITMPGRAVRLRAMDYPGQSEALNVSVPPFLLVTQRVADIAWHEASQTFFATVPANGGIYSNRLVAIDPATGSVTNSYPMGENLGQIELAPGANWLYVALSNAAALRRFDITTRQAGLQYALGNTAEPVRFAYDFCVPSGMADSVVVETRDRDFLGNTYRAGLKRYDSGVPVSLPNFDASGGWLLESMSSGAQVLLSSPLAKGNAASGSILATSTTATRNPMTFRDGVIYDDGGNFFSAANLGLLGTYPGVLEQSYHTALPEVNPTARRVFYLAGYFNYGASFYKLRVYDRDLLQPLLQLDVPSSSAAPSRFIRWGTNGLAYANGNGELRFIHPGLIQPDFPPADLQLAVTSAVPVAVVGGDYALTFSVLNAGPGTATLVRVTNSLPANVAVLGATMSTGSVALASSAFTWNIAALPAGASASLEATLRFGNAGWQTNFTYALGFEVDPVSASNVRQWPLNVQLPPSGVGVFPLNFASEDLLYDPVRDRLLLSVGSGLGGLNNGLAILDPYVGVVDSFVALGRRPVRLARSGDGQQLYISLPDAAKVRRLTLPNLQQNLEFSLGGTYTYNGDYLPFYAADLAAVPGAPSSLVVWRVNLALYGSSEGGGGIAVYDNGIMRSNVTAPGGSWSVEFGPGNSLFAYNAASPSLYSCLLDANGVSFSGPGLGLDYYAGADVEYAAGRFFSTAGRVVSGNLAATDWILAGAENGQLVEPDAASGRVFFLVQTSGWQINTYDLFTGRVLGSIAVTNVTGTPTSLIRWGTNGLAFRTTSNQVFLIRSPLVQTNTEADLSLSLTAPASPVAAGSNADFTLTITNRGPANAVSLTVTNTFSPGVTNISVSPATGSATTNGGILVWTIPALPAGAQAALPFTVRAAQAGLVTVTAMAQAATPDLQPSDNTALATLRVGAPPGLDGLTLLALPANDLVWSPSAGKLLMSSSTTVPNWGGGVLSLNPSNLLARFEAGLGANAGRLAVSPDDTRLYAGVDSGVVSLTLPDFAFNTRYPVGAGFSLYDLEVLPATNSSLLTAAHSGNYTVLAIYDGGTRRANTADFYTTGLSLEFGNDPSLFYYQDQAYGGFRRYAVNAQGLNLIDSYPALLPEAKPIELKWADGLLYTSLGIVVDPVTRQQVRAIPGITNNSPLCFDAASKRVFFLMPLGANAVLNAVDAVTTVSLGTRLLSGFSGAPANLVRWGADGLAFRTSAGQIGLLHSSLVPADAPADLELALAAAGPQAFVGSNFVYSVIVTNRGPNAATNAQIALRMSANAIFAAATASRGTAAIGPQQALASLGTLLPGDSAQVDVTVNPTQAGSLVAVASVTSSALDPDLTNNSRSLTTAALLFVARDAVVILSQPASDLIFNPVTGRLYASGNANAVAVINPSYSQVETNWPVPSQPGRLALSDDGQALYVALNSGLQLGRLHTSDGQMLTNFSLGTNDAGNPFTLVDMEVIPGAPDSVVINAGAGGARYVEVMDGGVARPARPQVVYASHLEFGADPSVIYLSGLLPLALSSNGVSVLPDSGVFASTSDFKYDSGWFYTDAGGQVRADERILSTRFAGLGTDSLIATEISRRRVYFLTRLSNVWQLRAYDPVTTDLVGALAITNVVGAPASLCRWGDDGLAFCTTSNQVFLLRPSLVPGGPAADLQVTQTPAPAGPVGIGSNVTFVVQITNAGPATAAGVVLLDRISTNATLVQAQLSQGTTNLSGGLLTCALGTLTNGGTAQLTLTLRPQLAGALGNRATVTAASTDSDLSNNTVTSSVGVQLNQPPDTARMLDLQAADIEYDPVSGLVYASLTNYTGPPYENSVIAIDPTTGLLGAPIPVGPKPSRLAISDDGSRLYSLVNSETTFRRINLLTGAVELNTPALGYAASDIKTVPARPESIVLARSLGGVTVYDDAVPRPGALIWYDQIEFFASSLLVGFWSTTVPNWTARLAVTTNGVEVVAGNATYLVDGAMKADGGLIYTSGGSVIDPLTLTKIRSFGVSGPVAPDGAANRVGFLTASGPNQLLRLLDTQGLFEWGAITITNVLGTPSKLIRCGGDRFAFRTTGGQVFIVRSSAMPTGVEADLALGTFPLSLSPTNGSPVEWLLTITNLGPNPATNLTVTNSLPTAMTLVSATASHGSTTLGGNTLNWSVSTLEPGVIATNRVLLLPGQAGIFTTRAVLRSSAKDTNSANNVRSQTWLIHAAPSSAAVTEIALRAADLIWEPVSQRLCASLPTNAPGYSNAVLLLDPVSGLFETPFAVGGDPGRLAVSGNGQYLYVGLNATASVARVQLSTRSVNLAFPINTGYDARELAVPPGQPDTVAVAREYFPSSGFGDPAGVALYRNGTELPQTIGPYTEVATTIAFATNSTRLYGYNGWSSEFAFRRFNVNSNGVTLQDATAGLISGFNLKIEFAGGLIFASSGTVLQPEMLTVVTNIPDISAGAWVKPDPASGLLSFLTQKSNTWLLRQYAHSNYALAREFRLPGVRGTPRSLARWGADGLAFLTSSNQLFLVRPPLAVADLAVQPVAWPTQALAGQAFQLAFSVSNRGPSAELDAFVTNTIPSQTEILGAQTDQGTATMFSNRVVFALGVLPTNAPVTFTVTLRATNSANLTLTNVARLVGAFVDPVASNNTAALSFTAKADNDRDGLPDDWELAHGLNPTNAADAALDFDCDGQSNLQEYLAGTDPLRFDNLRLTAPHFDAQGRFELTIHAAPGKSYTLETSANLTAWSPLVTFVCREADQKIQTPFTRTTSSAFFRLRSDTNAPLPLLTLLNGPSLATNAPVLQIIAPPGRRYSVQASTNLLNWIEITNYFGLTCTTVLSDPSPTGQSSRFYRALLQ